MIVVLEGTEAVGKSTLAKELIALWDDLAPSGGGALPLHAGPPDPAPPSIYEQYAAPLRDERFRAMALDPDWLVVLDRYHLGEVIYGPVLRDASGINEAQLTHLELTLDALGAFRVVVSALHEEIRERMGTDRGDLVMADVAIQLNGKFQLLAHQLGWPVVYPMSHRPRELAMDVLGKARVMNAAATGLLDHPGYVGAPRPMLLFVGDQPNGWAPGQETRPAFYPGDAELSSASYLLRALDSADASITYGLCNANDGTDLSGLWRTLGGPMVVGLGRAAQQKLNALGMRHADQPHPQWVRRFKHGDLEQYGHDLFFGEPIRRR